MHYDAVSVLGMGNDSLASRNAPCLRKGGRKMSAERADDLGRAVAAIGSLDRSGCVERWQKAFGRQPPKHLSPKFMRRVLIWHLQNRHLGGLSAATERRLKRIAAGKAMHVAAKPGSLLVREWNGRTYQVEVTTDGYVMDGKLWRSLTALARHITGAHWSGPRFFGLR